MRTNPDEEFSTIIFYLCLAIGIGVFTLMGWGVLQVIKEVL